MIDIIGLYKKEYEKNPVYTLFFSALILFLIISMIFAIITGGNSVYYTLFGDRNDTFMDYFNSIMYSSDRPYTYWTVIYPPFVTTIYNIIGHFIIPFVEVGNGEILSFALRDSQMGIMSYFFITFIALYILNIIISKIIKEKFRYRQLLFFLIMFSFPFIFAIERGNNILFAVLFCFIFLMGYRSENKWIRYLSYAALGCAAGFKIYPALFGLLILRDRKYKEFAICVAIVSALLFLPFIFTDGDPWILMDTIISFTSAPRTSFGFTNITQFMFFIFSGIFSDNTISLLSNVILILVSMASLIVIFFDKNMVHWKVITLIACNLIIGPGVGTPYLMIYLTIPIVFFLLSETKVTSNNLIFIIGFVMVLAVLPGFGSGGLSIIASLKTIFVMVITISLILEGFNNIYRDRKQISKKSTLNNGTQHKSME